MLGERIKELRESQDLKQDDICKLLNINQSTLSHWELNRRKPDIDQLIRLADIFKVSLDYLTGRMSFTNKNTGNK